MTPSGILRISLTSFFASAFALCSYGVSALALTQQEANIRIKELQNAQSVGDSIEILLDVYKLADKNHTENIGKQIINLAQRTNNHEMLGEMINELAASTDDTHDLGRLIEISETLPDNETRKTVETVLQMENAKAEAAKTKGIDLNNKTLDYARIGMSIGGDPYEEIRNIYRAMTFLGTSSQGPMYFEYILRLGDLVKNLPETDYAIKNLYYTTAAIFYTRKRDYEKAIENDRELIKQLDRMAELQKKSGVAPINLNYFYYVSYRRMLRNFRGLTPDEIEDIYRKCLQLAEEDPEVKETLASGGLTNSYYFIATEQYDKAIPELKKALAAEDISEFRRHELLGHLARAYRETGDSRRELQALREYTFTSLAERKQRFDDTYREIELRRTLNKMIAEENDLSEQQKNENRDMRKIAITLVYVLAVALIFMCRSYFKIKQRVSELETRNKRLHSNIEQIFDDGTPRGTRDLRRAKDRLKG